MEQTLGGHFRTTALLKSDRGIETFRGVDLDRGEQIVIKKASSTAVSTSTRLRLEHETRVLRDLSGRTSLAPPMDVGHEGGEFFLVARYVPGETLAERLCRGRLGPEDTVHIAQGLMRALREVHERGVIHRDVKPANIVLGDGARHAVTLIDFGLARDAQLDTWAQANPAGSVAYVSPEQAGLINVDVGERADLYSAGIVLYECLAGHPPFRASTAGEVLRQQLAVSPPELRSLGLPVPRALDALIQRLIRKDPRDRYQSAEAVLVDLDAIAQALESGQHDPSLVIGARDLRRTLTEPAFVGRDHELRALDGELDRAQGGEARLVFVEAESGAGKTRLLGEMAVHAAQRGSWVLRGQATSLGVQRPLQVFDGVARGIVARVREDPALANDLREALGEQREAVCVALPALVDVLGSGERPVTSEAHGEARTVPALTALLDALGTRERCAVLVLDDCQSADELSLKVIASWHKTHQANVLVAVAYRGDEVDVSHPLRRITPSQRLELPPLGPDEVRRLAESMAGELPAAAIDLVERLSQGNPFVATTALEGLVEGGALVDTRTGWTIDANAMASAQSSQRGATFLARRLERLPEPILELLSACAILGKTFDPALAADLIGRPVGEAMNGLLLARRRHLVWLDSKTDRFSFAHDRVRARLLERLPPDERKRLHRLAAKRLEIEDDGSRASRRDLAFDLAYHFDEAGDSASALPYALEAAARARARYALEIAERHYRIAERGVEGASPEQRRRVEEALADVLMLRGHYDEAAQHLERSRTLATSPLAKADIEGKLGELAFKRGRVDLALSATERALAILGWRLPTSSFALAVGMFFQAALQLLHTLFPRVFLGRRSASRREADLLAVRLFSRLAYAYWFTRGQVATFYAHLRELNIAECHPPGCELAQAYSEHALGMTGLPRIFFRRGMAYAERGLAIRRRLGDLPGEAQSLSFLAMLQYAAGDYRTALERFRDASRVLRRIGDRWEANIAGFQIAFCLYRMGALREAVEECRRVFRDGTEIGDAHATAMVLEVWAKATGGAAPAELVQAALVSARDAQTRESVLQAEALRALHDGDAHRAADTIGEAEWVVRAAKLKSEYVSYLSLWRGHALRIAAEQMEGTVVVPRPRRLPEAERAIRHAVRIARRYRGNLPMALREKSLLLARRGALVRAQHAVERSLAEAQSLGTRFEYAQSLLVHGELHRFRGLAGADAEIAQARAMLHDLGGDFVLRARRDGRTLAEPPVTLSLADRFATVVDIGRRIASAIAPDEIYEATRAAAASLLRGQASTVLRIDGGDLHVVACSPGNHAPVSRTLVVRALAQRRTVVWTEGDHDSARDSGALAGVRSALCAPIVVSGRDAACLYVTHTQVGALFGDEEQRLAEYIVALAGASLEKADAFAQLHALSLTLEQRVKERTAELRAANEELDTNLRRLREAQEQLVQTGKMAAMGTLVAGLSHEINNPVAVIVAQAQNLLRKLPDDDPLRHPIEAIGRQARRCAELVRTMLDFSRKSSGARVATSIEQIVRDVVELSRAKARRDDVTLSVDALAADLPKVEVSRTEVESAVLNLVNNAIDASKRGDTVRLAAAARERDGRSGVEILVEDHGSGIAPEELPRIFDPFYTTKPVGKGTGLGLSLALQIVEGHGGHLAADSTPGRGTTMHLWLPAGGAR